MPSQPNIVLIMADQLAPQFLPCYGHPIVHAPAIERLADNGVVFDAAYTNSPLCAPSRFVMMSGRLPSKIAAWDNAAEFKADVPTFAHYLEAQGYHTALSGKMHFVGPDQLHGFRSRLTTDVYPADFTWHPEWDLAGKRLDWYHNMEVVTKAGVCTRSMYLDYDDEALFKAKRFLFEQAKDDDASPFMLTLSFIQPHDPYLCRSERWDLYKDLEIDLPITPFGSVADDAHSHTLRHSYGASDLDVSDDMMRSARRAYYGSVSDVDAKVAELMTALDETGFSDNTIVMFTADHGDMLGERGMWFKMSYYEHSARVPLIVNAPWIPPRRVSEAVSLVDLCPTLVDLATDGGDWSPATALEGRSLAPHIHGTGGHDEVIGEYFGEGVSTPTFMVRRGDKKWVDSAGMYTHVYDLAADPYEHNNLAGSGALESFELECAEFVSKNYNRQALTEQVLESQHARAFLKGVMRKQKLAWDHNPRGNAANEYIRNSMPPYELEKRARFPKV